MQSVAELLGKYISNGGNLEGVTLNSEQQSFYQNLSSTDKTKVDEILSSTFKNLSSEELSYFRNLGSDQQGYVGLLAESYFINHAGILSSTVSEREIAFYQGLSSEQKKIVDNFKATQMSDLSAEEEQFLDGLNQEEEELVASLIGVAVISDGELVADNMNKTDRDFYQNLDQAEQGIVGGIASASLSQLSPADAQFINGLSDEDKASLGKLTKAHISSTLGAGASTEELVFDSPEVERIQELISRMVAAQLYGVELAFTEEHVLLIRVQTSVISQRSGRNIFQRRGEDALNLALILWRLVLVKFFCLRARFTGLMG